MNLSLGIAEQAANAGTIPWGSIHFDLMMPSIGVGITCVFGCRRAGARVDDDSCPAIFRAGVARQVGTKVPSLVSPD